MTRSFKLETHKTGATTPEGGSLRAAGELLWFGAASLAAGLAVALSAAAVVIFLV